MSTGHFRYAAFISYSHRDASFSKRLHRRLETYKIPKSAGRFDIIGGGKPNRIYPVFRDREELASGTLTKNITDALRASATLVVICSKNSAKSEWVKQEVDFFIQLGRSSEIFLIIPDNAASEADPLTFMPNASLNSVAAGDARKGKDSFGAATLKVIAGIIGKPVGQLVNRDRRRRHIQIVQATAGLGVASIAGYFGLQAAVQPMVGLQLASATNETRRAVIEQEGKKRVFQALHDLDLRAKVRVDSARAVEFATTTYAGPTESILTALPDIPYEEADLPRSLYDFVRMGLKAHLAPFPTPKGMAPNTTPFPVDPVMSDIEQEQAFVAKALGIPSEQAANVWNTANANDHSKFRNSPHFFRFGKAYSDWRQPDTPAAQRLSCVRDTKRYETVFKLRATNGEERTSTFVNMMWCGPVFSSPNGNYLATGFADQIVLFNANSGQLLGTFNSGFEFLNSSSLWGGSGSSFDYIGVVIDEADKKILVNYSSLPKIYDGNARAYTEQVEGTIGRNETWIGDFSEWEPNTFAELARTRCKHPSSELRDAFEIGFALDKSCARWRN